MYVLASYYAFILQVENDIWNGVYCLRNITKLDVTDSVTVITLKWHYQSIYKWMMCHTLQRFIMEIILLFSKDHIFFHFHSHLHQCVDSVSSNTLHYKKKFHVLISGQKHMACIMIADGASKPIPFIHPVHFVLMGHQWFLWMGKFKCSPLINR